MVVLQDKTRERARTLQILYAWELLGRPEVHSVVTRLGRIDGVPFTTLLSAEGRAQRIAKAAAELDAGIEAASDNWRIERIGTVERNILRIGLAEILDESVPVRVAINEAVRLAHWFGGQKTPAFVNGVLDSLARQNGRL